MEVDKSPIAKNVVKLAFCAFVIIVGIDTLPLGISDDGGPFVFVYKLKSAIRPALRPVGLWQSEWRLFAPDPVINNCWWTIEVRRDAAGEWKEERLPALTAENSSQSEAFNWNSPFWGEISAGEKFFKRRHIAYARRLSEFPIEVIEDFADEWVRKRYGNRFHPLGNVPIEEGVTALSSGMSALEMADFQLELSIYRNELKMAIPDDGTLPSREDTTWLSVTEKFLQRRYGL